jgi:integrase/recombinase XerC/integrase/recombinase XerD
MGTIHRLPGVAAVGPELGRAADAFLTGVTNANTAKAYAITLRGLVAEFGVDTPLGVLDTERGVDDLATWFTRRWGSTAPTTFNARMDALRSASGWWRDQQWLDGDPTRRLQRRGAPAPGDQSLDRAELERFLARPDLPLRERTLWQLLYESAARTEEVLALDVPDLDRPNRRAPVRRKGGASDTIAWQTKTARLLPRLLDGRTEGPLFLTHRRARVELASVDLDPASGRARLSYRRAEELLGEWTADLQSGPWDLHQLRHSALTHAAEDGASTPMLMALSGHTNVNSLGRYSKVSAAALARWQAERDPAARRR